MNLLAHLAYVAIVDRPHRCVGFQATCACGWHGPTRDTDRRAWGDVDTHETDHPMSTHIGRAAGEPG